jgi:hypothetical protein
MFVRGAVDEGEATFDGNDKIQTEQMFDKMEARSDEDERTQKTPLKR